MDVLKLLERWCVILLPRVREPCSLEAWSVGTMLYDWGRKVRFPLCMRASADLSGVAKASKGRGAGFLIVCVHELLECVEPWLSLTLSFFLSLYFFPLSLFLFFSFLSFFLFFISLFFLSFFFKQARADIFLKQGYFFGWLEHAARRSAISPTLGLLCESQVCNVRVSFQLCSNSKEHQSVQLMQSSCFWASYVPVLINRQL